ncbi:MAG: hypothetical protein LBS14_02095 [Holosporaceae bacterium]|jgi:predicted Zn-dependent peptidase|nr:hypothetical protein [Holosporaceae bacterium]
MSKLWAVGLLFFCHQTLGEPEKVTAENKLKRCILSNGIDVLLHEDFRTPIVIVGIILHTGTFDVPLGQSGITYLISKNLISRSIYNQLRELGISWNVNVHERHTEIVAKMNPKHIDKFFQIICNNRYLPRDLEILKKKVVIRQKLAHSGFEDAVSNEIFANIRYENANVEEIFNEKRCLTISSDDVKAYFDQHYLTCHMSLIVCGAVGYKNLIKTLQSTICNLPRRLPIPPGSACINTIPKEVDILSKFIARSLQYFYRVPKEDLAYAQTFFYALSHRIFNYLEKSMAVISGYAISYVISNGDGVYQVALYPKLDVSLENLQQAYSVFVDRECKIPLESLPEIMREKNAFMQIWLADLNKVYSHIKENYLDGIDCEIDMSSPKQFNSLIEKILKNNLILKVKTQYRTDR